MKNVIKDYQSGLSIYKIAVKNGCTHKRIKKILVDNNIPLTDGRGTTLTNEDKIKIVELYNSGVPVGILRSQYKTRSTNINKILKDANIQIRSLSEQAVYKPKKEAKVTNSLDVDKIIDLYVNNQYSLLQLSREFKCSPYCCRQVLLRNNIPIRDCNCELYTNRKYGEKPVIEPYKDESEILEYYKKYSLGETCEQFARADKTVRKILRKNGIPLRDRSAARIGRPRISKLRLSLPDSEIIELYKQNLSMEEISKRYGTTSGTIKSILRKHNIEIHYLDEKWFRKTVVNSFRSKPYTLPSGRVIKLQGYEPQFLDYVFGNNIYKEEDFDFTHLRIPYEINNKRHYYFPDFRIPNQNLIVEIKSSYILKKQGIEITEAKKQATLALGHKYLMIVDNNFENLKEINKI